MAGRGNWFDWWSPLVKTVWANSYPLCLLVVLCLYVLGMGPTCPTHLSDLNPGQFTGRIATGDYGVLKLIQLETAVQIPVSIDKKLPRIVLSGTTSDLRPALNTANVGLCFGASLCAQSLSQGPPPCPPIIDF